MMRQKNDANCGLSQMIWLRSLHFAALGEAMTLTNVLF